DANYYYGYKILLYLMPPPESASPECMNLYFREVIMGYFEWSYHETDEYGIKMSEYAHLGVKNQIDDQSWKECWIYGVLKEFGKHWMNR
ncbi:MAG: hypothetical protein ACP5NO_08460, partial [Thermoplasmata archaeon]